MVAGFVGAVVLAPGHGLAQPVSVQAFVTVDLNQRAGPGTKFPVLVVAPGRSQVALHGCLSDLSWCDGTFQGSRGWFSARYLQLAYQGTSLPVATYSRYAYLPIVSFDINSYWARYYPTRPFYAQLAAYASASGGAVTISISSFYQPLSQYGSWVLVRGRYVWAPRVAANWRPYTDGHWAYTEIHGWMWVSNEPFGWATYHYGRWAYSPTIGWFWVPGTRWAPAWVSWRQSDDYLAWAPLPPDPQDSFGISVNISIGDIPNYYWQAVPARDFQATNLANVVIGDNNQITNIVNQTQVIGDVNIVNNVVVNNVVNVTFVEEKTKQTVVAHKVALTADADQSGAVQGDTIEVFQPLAAAPSAVEAPPPEVTPIEQVGQQSLTVGQAGNERATEDLVPPPPAPGETPPPTEGPGGQQAELPAGQSAAPAEGAVAVPEQPAPVVQGPPPCAEGTLRQQDGTCGAPPASPPLADEVTPQAPPPTPPEQVLPPQPPTPPEQVQPPQSPSPPEQVQPPQPPTPPEQVLPPQPPTPPEQVQSPTPPEQVQPLQSPNPPEQVQPPQPPTPPEQRSPTPPEQVQPPQPPTPPEQVRPPRPPAPPEQVQPQQRLGPPEQAQQPIRPPCPEGYIVNDQGFCVLP